MASPEILRDLMVKRTVVKSNRVFNVDTAKSRWFILRSTSLVYMDGSLEKGPTKLKGTVPIQTIKSVDVVDLTKLDKNMVNGFQIWFEDLANNSLKTLYINAQSPEMRDKWVKQLHNLCASQGVKLEMKYHPDVWTSKAGCYLCCGQPSKEAPACHDSQVAKKYMSSPNPSRRPGFGGDTEISPCPILERPSTLVHQHSEPVALPTSRNDLMYFSPTSPDMPRNTSAPTISRPLPPVNPVSPMQRKAVRKVLVLFDYKSTQPGDLDIEKGETIDIIDDKSESHWWRAVNSKGEEGFIPSNYVKEVSRGSPSPPESFPWFFSVSKSSAEMMLKEDGREGCYLVRKSEQKANSYTLALYCKQGNPSASPVRHYHIRTTNDQPPQYYLSERHPSQTIDQLLSYHSINCAGLITRLRFYLHEQPAPPTVGLCHGQVKVSAHDLEFTFKLGSGQFGEVWKAIYKGVKEVAVKKTLKGALNDHEFVEEAKTMMVLQHPSLVQLYGICEEPDFLIITEYMEGGALSGFLKKRKPTILSQTHTLLDMVNQVVRAMAYLESQKVIHRDLAARNCLVRDPNVVKVADFGLARHVVDDEYTSSIGSKFPIRWSSPEVLQFNKFSSKSDVWAFGVLVYEVFTGGDMPYKHLSRNNDVTNFITNQKGHLPKPPDCPYDVYQSIMIPCFKYNEDDRPSFSRLIEIVTEARSDYGEQYSTSPIMR